MILVLWPLLTYLLFLPLLQQELFPNILHKTNFPANLKLLLYHCQKYPLYAEPALVIASSSRECVRKKRGSTSNNPSLHLCVVVIDFIYCYMKFTCITWQGSPSPHLLCCSRKQKDVSMNSEQITAGTQQYNLEKETESADRKPGLRFSVKIFKVSCESH